MGKYEDFLKQNYENMTNWVTKLWHKYEPKEFAVEVSKQSRFALCYRYNNDPDQQGLGQFIFVDCNGQSCLVSSVVNGVSQAEVNERLSELRDDLPRERDLFEMVNAVKAYKAKHSTPLPRIPDESEDDYKIATHFAPNFHRLVVACRLYVEYHERGCLEE